jgi:hypothetical protein
MLNTDIGIDLEGYMHVLFKSGTQLPAETSILVEPTSNEVELGFYQGPHVYVKDNTFLGGRTLVHNIDSKMGRFEIKCLLDTNSNSKSTLKIYIGELIEEYTYCNDVVEVIISPEEETIRETENARQVYKEYIRETIHTLEEITDKISPKLIERVRWASGILNVENVTKDEYEQAQLEVESWLKI